MGQFKPMVKMMTTEPSVILKLKKGGKVSKMAMGGNDFVPMQSTMTNGMPSTAAPMGMAPKRPSMAMRRKAMNPSLMMKKGGKAEKHEDAAQDRAMIKKAMAGKKFASGGEIDSAETKTTIKGNAKKFLNTKVVDGDKTDKAHGTKGIKESNAGGYKMGGTIEGNASKFLNTKVVDGDKTDKAHGTGGVKNSNGGGFKKGGKVPGLGRAIEGGNWENRAADTAKPGISNGTTGGVKEGNGGGYKHGGKASKKAYATGGNVVSDGKAVKMPKHFLSRPVANSLQSGTFAKGGKVNFYSDLAKKMQKDPEKPNLRLVKTHTGPKGHVAKVYKDKDYGEYRTKFYSPEGKHHTEADSHTDDAEDAHMTAMHEVNKGYKKGGKISRKADGGLQDLSKGQYDKSIGPDADDMDMARSIRNIPSKLFEGAKSMMGMGAKSAGAGRGFVNPKSVTETEKSVTVTPRKRGGMAC